MWDDSFFLIIYRRFAFEISLYDTDVAEGIFDRLEAGTCYIINTVEPCYNGDPGIMKTTLLY